MDGREKREGLELASVAVVVWVAWDTITGLYFGAGFFGDSPPSWLNWVGTLNPILFNVIDTMGLLALVLVVVLSRPKRRRSRE